MVYLHENCSQESKIYKPRQEVEPEGAGQTPDQWCMFVLGGLLPLKVTRGFECDYRMLNGSFARSAARLAQGVGQSSPRLACAARHSCLVS